jgi:tripeptide aminopeptidase
VRAMALAITRMPLGRIDEETTANIGLVSGGSANNVIPERAEMSGEARSHDRSKLAKQVQAMLEAAEGAAREIGTRLSVEHEREFDGYFLLDGHPLLLMLEGMAARCGLEYKPITAGGASDANVFNARGLPAAVLCCGYYAPHTTREKLAIPQMEDLARWVRAIMERS